jgi:ubiquinone/menaquinone biosynthesis C-methylase UbiE
VRYDPRYLEILPEEILERDYGCGDPSRFVRPGETVLDLGSGSGKICFILAQIVGPSGRVIGVDFNDEMLALSEKYREEIAGKLGYRNVEFRKGRIQDLSLDCAKLDVHLAANPIQSSDDLLRLRRFEDELRRTAPLVADASVDVIVSNCVLNLVRPEDKSQLFREMARVLRSGGRVAISDIVADEEVPGHLQKDPDLWSGCVSGAFQETAFLRAFEEAGFQGISLETWEATPYRVVEGIEFRSVTVTAWKGEQGPCLERNQAVIYRGPWKSVTDDDGHTLPRGVRMPVCEKTYRSLSTGPFRADLVFLDPRVEVPLAAARPFDCNRTEPRHPRETKGLEYRETTGNPGSCCGPEPGCC